MTNSSQPEKKQRGRPTETRPLASVGPEFVTRTPQDMIDSEARANSILIQHGQNLAVIDQKFGEGLPYDRRRLESETAFFLNTSSISMLEAGRRLIVLKEHEEHGGFLASLERIGLAPRTAQRMMQATVKLASKPTLATLGATKMFELLSEDDETLDALENGSSVAGLNLDDIQKMSSRELRAALRKAKDEAKAQSEVHEKLLDLKNQKLDEMDKQFLERTTRVKSWAGVVLEIGANLTTMSAGVVMNVHHLRAQIDQILSEAERFNLSEEEMGAIVVPFQQRITHMYTEFRELIAEFDNNLSGYLPVYNAPQE